MGIEDAEEAEEDSDKEGYSGDEGAPEEDVEAGDEDEFSGEIIEEEKEDS